MKTPFEIETDWVFDGTFPCFEWRKHIVNLLLRLVLNKAVELIEKKAGCGIWPAGIKFLGERKIWIYCEVQIRGGFLLGLRFGVGQKPFVTELFEEFEAEAVRSGRHLYSTQGDHGTS